MTPFIEELLEPAQYIWGRTDHTRQVYNWGAFYCNNLCSFDTFYSGSVCSCAALSMALGCLRVSFSLIVQT